VLTNMPTTYQDVLDLVQAIEPSTEAVAQLDADALPYLESFIAPPAHLVPVGTMGSLGDAPTEEVLVVEPFFDVSLARRAAALVVNIRDARAVPVALRAAASEYPEVRLAVAAGIWRLAEFGVADTLAGLVNDADGGVRRFALLSVARIAPGPFLEAIRPRVEEAVRFLQARDSEPAVRVLAPFVLQRLEGARLTRDDVRRALEADVTLDDVALAIGREGLPHLIELVESDDPEEAARAVYLADRVGGDAAGPAIKRAAEHDSPEVRLAAARAISRTFHPGDEDVLQRLLADQEPAVRRMTIASSARLSSFPEVPKLVETVARTDRDDDVRDLADELLRRQNASRTQDSC
jgi:HEAT repeat protein